MADNEISLKYDENLNNFKEIIDNKNYNIVSSKNAVIKNITYESGEKVTCSVCNDVVESDIPKLAAHVFSETKQTVAADHDVIGYDIYTCETDNVRKIVWDAHDVTLDTDNVKYNNEVNYTETEGGLKFGSRPIGNDVDISDLNNNHEPVYNAEVPGTFVEYKINLASSMVGAQLSSLMKPGQWLDQKGGLFMAANAGADWTPGLIADETATNGYKISDFRIIVYVNGKLVTMDPSKNIAANAATQKGWYDFPCTVDLKKGENIIKFVHAGGWEPVFYNFGVTSADAIANPIPATAEGFEVGITGDEHVTSITFFEDKAATILDTADKHYSRNEFGRKLNDGDGQISFAVQVEEGYKVKGIRQVTEGELAYKNFKYPVSTEADCGRTDVYRITKIERDVEFEVITEEDTVVETGFSVTFVAGEHVSSIVVYAKNTFADEDIVSGLVAISVHKNSQTPSTDAENAQVYIKVTFEEGYGYDLSGVTYSTEAKPFKNIEEVTAGTGNYKFTKINRDATITITGVAIA